jgi:6-phosphogluconolactonase
LTPDLGLDEVITYQFDPAIKEPLIISSVTFTKSEKGSGPRHLVFSPDKKFVYLLHEMGGTVTAYHYNHGKLAQIQDIPAFPDGFVGRKDGAEICTSPDGKFLYASTRGELNSIAIFSIDRVSGKLTVKGSQSTFGKGPRNFIIDPTGNYLLAANQDSRNIVIFKRDKETGLLIKTDKEIEVPRPVCLQMIPNRQMK